MSKPKEIIPNNNNWRVHDETQEIVQTSWKETKQQQVGKKKKLFNYKLKLKYSPLEQKICNFCRLGKSSVGTQESYKISRIKLL